MRPDVIEDEISDKDDFLSFVGEDEDVIFSSRFFLLLAASRTVAESLRFKLLLLFFVVLIVVVVVDPSFPEDISLFFCFVFNSRFDLIWPQYLLPFSWYQGDLRKKEKLKKSWNVLVTSSLLHFLFRYADIKFQVWEVRKSNLSSPCLCGRQMLQLDLRTFNSVQ